MKTNLCAVCILTRLRPMLQTYSKKYFSLIKKKHLKKGFLNYLVNIFKIFCKMMVWVHCYRVARLPILRLSL